ncbi:MAG TPA: twin-arginine translocase subunit TatC [Candidatus Udaeobacter sp.]|nr:twin-arginine translocase subunit TatC [Candidatus Udaeobacter sp.]
MSVHAAPDSESGRPREGPRAEMPFLDHLEALRRVLFQSAIACAIAAIAAWWWSPRVLEDVIHRTVGHAVVLSPLEALNERIKMSLVLGVAIALPIILHRLWSFVVPGLLGRERRWIPAMAAASYVLFATGAWAAYGYVVPLVVRVLGGFVTPSMTPEIRLSELLGFTYNMALACGVVFQLPLVCMTLTAIGLVTPRDLLRQWRFAIVGVFIVTAVITPGDVVTAQLVMGIPMVALYFLSVGLSWLVARRGRGDDENRAGEAIDG